MLKYTIVERMEAIPRLTAELPGSRTKHGYYYDLTERVYLLSFVFYYFFDPADLPALQTNFNSMRVSRRFRQNVFDFPFR